MFFTLIFTIVGRFFYFTPYNCWTELIFHWLSLGKKHFETNKLKLQASNSGQEEEFEEIQKTHMDGSDAENESNSEHEDDDRDDNDREEMQQQQQQRQQQTKDTVLPREHKQRRAERKRRIYEKRKERGLQYFDFENLESIKQYRSTESGTTTIQKAFHKLMKYQLSRLLHRVDFCENQQKRQQKVFPTQVHKKFNQLIVSLQRDQFEELMRVALALFDYGKVTRCVDFRIACEIQEHKRPLIVLFGGTSGCGKSTLASLTASRLGINKVLSTDSVRHMLRSFKSKKECPVLYASTYHAGECLPNDGIGNERGAAAAAPVAVLTPEQRVIEGYKEQCKLVMEQVEKIIEHCERTDETLLIEGVHLLTDFVVEMMKKHKHVVPYIVYISNEYKHRERFAIRAKYMTLDANTNKYVKYFANIRVIQNYLCERADCYNIPKVDNTNIDRSLATIHYSVFKCLKKIYQSEQEELHSSSTNGAEAMEPPLQQSITNCSPLFNMEKNKADIPFSTFDERQMKSKEVLGLVNRSLSDDISKKNTGSVEVKLPISNLENEETSSTISNAATPASIVSMDAPLGDDAENIVEPISGKSLPNDGSKPNIENEEQEHNDTKKSTTLTIATVVGSQLAERFNKKEKEYQQKLKELAGQQGFNSPSKQIPEEYTSDDEQHPARGSSAISNNKKKINLDPALLTNSPLHDVAENYHKRETSNSSIASAMNRGVTDDDLAHLSVPSLGASEFSDNDGFGS